MTLKMPRSLFEERLKNLRSYLKKHRLPALLLDNPIDIFYITGCEVSLGRVIVHQEEAKFFVDGRYFQACSQKSAIPVGHLAAADQKKFAGKKGKIGFDSAFTTVEDAERLNQLFPKRLEPLASPLRKIRAIKSSVELEIMRRSAQLNWKGFLHVKKKLKVGVTEKEMAWEFERFCRENGASALAFEPIIAFGENTAMPHYRAGDRRLKKGDLVLVDIGVMIDHYDSDMTRTFAFGKVDPILEKLMTVVRASHAAALKICKPGQRLGMLDKAARDVMRKEKLEKLYLHSLGHGVGLEIHEWPRLKVDGIDKDVVLECGMVITIEPGLYMAGIGGVRHEDTIAITKTGYENFYEK
ncbi:MAG: aminopeptidase P family protein [Verrucomicrobia bacterium]|nr:aminopeptidase P family protein [Verrucomicrobiota bacterium]